MFCRCDADYFGKEPNSQTCPVCLGLPGALPNINREAIIKCLQIGLALGCKINQQSRFERKNYFYPDLPKGYQVSQLRWPLCVKGELMVADKTGLKQAIRINRVHQEEDTGKLTHQDGETLIDFNRSSVPLVEVVTEPDFVDPIQVRNYAKLLQQIFRDLGVSDADMEKGQLRLEANISVRKCEANASVRPVGQKELPPYRVELKNINSFRFMVAAVEYEIKRQIEAQERGEKLVQETRGWDENRQKTFIQRSKEEANDYRYFPEPDLPEMQISDELLKRVESSLPQLTFRRLDEYSQKYGLSAAVIASFTADSLKLSRFEESLVLAGEAITPTALANFWANLNETELSEMSATQGVMQIKQRVNDRVSDESELEKVALAVIAENPAGAVEAYQAGKESAIQVLIGMMMRNTGGKADAQKAKAILVKLLKAKN
jgi:aspartyl-tRNA(Asn)/glutamyl-tRNA(Gln) amidotransferase subunit B